MYIQSINFSPDQYPNKDYYPFNLDIFNTKQTLDLANPVTFFMGENGTGKSTLLRAIALKCNIYIWENSERTQVKYNPYANELYRYITLDFYDGELRGSFFGSEIFRHFAEQLDEWAKTDPGILKYFGGQSLTTKSHGQGNMAFFDNRFKKDGLYLLDEPESALSPKSQIEFLRIISRSIRESNAQFIITTHSPILLAMPGSVIYSFEKAPVSQVSYTETDYYNVYKSFLENPSGILQELD